MSHSERIHLAQELHDGIAQDLVGVGYSLDLLLAAPHTPVATRIDLRILRFTIDGLLEKVRSEIHQLHSGDGKNLAERIAESANVLCEGMVLDLQLENISIPADGEVAYAIHQIAREFIRNASVHSRATSLQISLAYSNKEITLKIQDDGIGGMSETPHHFGLVGAKTRAASLGGTLRIDSLSTGTKIELRIPIEVLTA